MLIFLLGKDEVNAYKKAKIWKDSVLKDLKISTTIIFQEKNYESEDLGTIATDVSIFGDKNAYFIKLRKDELFSEKQIEEFINSENLFAILSNNEELKSICEKVVKERKIAKQFFALEIVDELKKEYFPSHFVEALQKKDKKQSWKILRELLEEKEAEKIYGVCIFAYKSLFASATFISNSPNSGIKDLSFNIAKRNLSERMKNTKINDKDKLKVEIQNKYFDLVKLLPASRMNNVDLGLNLEKWILEN